MIARYLAVALLFLCVASAVPSELRFAMRSEPRTLNPALVDDEASELIRFLTGGVLIRVNRSTQKLESELATNWALSPDGKRLRLLLRSGVRFSDGSPFDASDVDHTFRLLTDPAHPNATADAFRSGDKAPVVQKLSDNEVVIVFATPLASAARLLDQVAIVSSRSQRPDTAVLGPYQVSEYRRGSHMLLRRNPNYWKKDSTGRSLPYIDQLRITFQANRELEALAFRRGEIDLISSLDARVYEDLSRDSPDRVHDLGTSMDSEFLWFNQVPSSSLPDYRKQWFQSTAFRQAISSAIDRRDVSRLVYKGHAIPAVGPYPPANKLWFNPFLPVHNEKANEVRKMFAAAGFRESGGVLRDAKGNPVAFTLMTNAGNKAREQIAALIQRDLKRFGIQVNIATLEFRALLERMTKTWQYDACLLGLVNVDLDPNGMMNVWLSSGANHQWNPSQVKPATAWENEIDSLMKLQASSALESKRVAAFRKVQSIVREQEPFIYLVHPNALGAWAPALKNVKPVSLRPSLLWNIEYLYLSR